MKHPQMNWLKRIVYGLIVLSIITFLTGFLQYTQFEFVIYIFYFILAAVGVKLIVMTLESKATGVLKGFLLLTGFSSTIYFLFFVIAAIGNISMGTGITEFMEMSEGLLYLDSLILIISIIGSLITLKNEKKTSK